MTLKTMLPRRALALLATVPALALGRVIASQPVVSRTPSSIGGVVGEIDRATAVVPPEVTRGMQPELLGLVPPTQPGALPFPGELRAWLDRADARYFLGGTAQIGVESTVPAFVQALGINAKGRPTWLFPPDNLTDTSAVVPSEAASIRPGEPLLIPQPDLHGFVLRLRAPVGAALIFVIATTKPLTRDLRLRLQARLEDTSDPAASHRVLRAELGAIAREESDLRLVHLGLPYVSDDAAVVTLPEPSLTTSGRAFDWLRPTPNWARSLSLAVEGSVFHAGERLVLRLRTERACELLVLALGSGGQVDVLYPNSRQHGALLAGGELLLPPAGGDLRFRLRGPRFAQPEQERVLAITWPVGLPSPILALDAGRAATLTFAPDSVEGRALEAVLRMAEPNRVVAELHYQVSPPRVSTIRRR